jgi:hypothetical protein
VNIRITDHAIKRYRERVGPLPKDNMLSRMELLSRLFSGKPKHVRKALGGKRTAMIPLSDCFLVFSFGTMVTVLKRIPA